MTVIHEGGGTVEIRAATLADVHRLAVLCGQLGYPTTPEKVRQRLEQIQRDEDQAVFVAEEIGGEVVGWVHVFGRQLLVVDRHAELGGLIVAESHRGRGAGRLLMKQVEAWAQARGCETLYVRTNIVREGAHRFYEGIGYDLLKTSRVFLKKLGGPG